MNRFPVWTLFILFLLVGTVTVRAQCCDVPNGSPYFDDLILWDGVDITDRSVSYNGTLFVEGDMRIINSTVTLEGKGIVVNSTGSLTVIDSMITSGSAEHGFYIDLLGDAYFDSVTLEGCIDEENGYFGLYLEHASLTASELTMERSGMISVDGGNIGLERSNVSGIISYSGNITLKGTNVELTGITQYGQGKVEIRDSTVTTNLSFSQTAGISVMSGAELSIEGLKLDGSFNAGIHVTESTIAVKSSEIDIADGLFGFSASDSVIEVLEGLKVTGTGTGIELVNCSIDGEFSSNEINSSYIGINVQGNNPFMITDTSVSGSTFGITSNAPMTLSNISFIANDVGLLIEDGYAVNVSGCSFEKFGQWAIEDETWTERAFPGNNFEPSESSIGIIAWWGWLEINTIGPGGIPVLGADIIIRSSLGSNLTVRATDVGVIWGYRMLDGGKGAVNYTLEAKWGTAKEDMEFVPEKDKVVEVVIPLTDISISDMEVSNGQALVTVQANRSTARDVMVEVFVDGVSWDQKTVEVPADSERTVTIDLPTLEEGAHSIEAKISSRDEYSGMNGYLQVNNAKSMDISVDREPDNGLINVLLVSLVVLAVGALLVLILLRRKE